MAYSLPNGSTFDVAATYSTNKIVTEVSNTNPAVVTSAAHGLTDGDIIMFNSAWVKLNNRAFRVIDADADEFTLEGVDTTDTTKFPVGGGSGTFKEVLTWVQIPQIMSVDYSGGEQSFYTWQFLESDDEMQLPTNKTAISMTLVVADDPDQPFVTVVEKYDEGKATHALRLNLVNRSSILYPAVVTITSTPTLTVNELMTRSISLAMQGRPSRYKPLTP